VATYNELQNLPQLVNEILRELPAADLLVIDDNSPDGTGLWCDERAAQDRRVRCLHRPKKLGLGTATMAGMRYAIEHDYAFVLTMDADFSHPPRYLPKLLAGMTEAGSAVDVMIGSRYVPGGGIEGWPLYRRWMSRCVNLYARTLLGLPIQDCSGAFRCYRTAVLEQMDLDTIRSRGYAYLEEILWRLKKLGVRFAEAPIIFVDRQRGRTKINIREAIAALWIILRLGLQRR
jgi:dolichol-phosphate mannosyltransferase